MPVEKDINLDKPLSEADIRQMEEDASRLEELAKKAEANSEKASSLQSKEDQLLNDAVKKVEQIEKEAEKAEKARTRIKRTITEVNQLAEHRTALGNIGGEEDFEESEAGGFEGMGGRDPFTGRLKTGRTAFGTGQEKSPMGTIIRLQAQLEEAVKLAEQQKKEQKKIEKEIRDQFKEIAELDHMLDRRAGRVFFTSDVELQSGPPEVSNTTRQRDRVVQFQNWNVGGA